MNDFDIISDVLASEGSAYTCDPRDPGGATKYGVTIPALTDMWLDRATNGTPTAADIQALTIDSARDFYGWLMAHTNVAKIPNDMLRWVVFDAVVNLGRSEGVKVLQRALGVTDDGILGNATIGACPILDGSKVARLFLTEQALFYAALVKHSPSQLVFLDGWLARWARKMRAVA